jgi:hypothetical protein
VKNGDFAPEQEEKGQSSWNERIARNFKANRWNFRLCSFKYHSGFESAESVASLAALDAKFLQNKAKIKEEKALKIINMARDYVNGQTNVFSAGAARALAFKTDSFFKQKHSRLFEESKDESIQVTPTIDLAWMTPDIPNPAIWCEGGDKIALWSY